MEAVEAFEQMATIFKNRLGSDSREFVANIRFIERAADHALALQLTQNAAQA